MATRSAACSAVLVGIHNWPAVSQLITASMSAPRVAAACAPAGLQRLQRDARVGAKDVEAALKAALLRHRGELGAAEVMPTLIGAPQQ